MSFGKRAFSSAAPSSWNFLPVSVLDSDSLARFKSKLKTHLFTIAYSGLLFRQRL